MAIPISKKLLAADVRAQKELAKLGLTDAEIKSCRERQEQKKAEKEQEKAEKASWRRSALQGAPRAVESQC